MARLFPAILIVLATLCPIASHARCSAMPYADLDAEAADLQRLEHVGVEDYCEAMPGMIAKAQRTLAKVRSALASGRCVPDPSNDTALLSDSQATIDVYTGMMRDCTKYKEELAKIKAAKNPAETQGCFEAMFATNTSCQTAGAVAVQIVNKRCGRTVYVRACIEGKNGKDFCGSYNIEPGGNVTHYVCSGGNFRYSVNLLK